MTTTTNNIIFNNPDEYNQNLLELQDNLNLSREDLEDLPWDRGTTYSRFFEVIYAPDSQSLGVLEFNGYHGAEFQFDVVLKEKLSQQDIESIRERVQGLHNKDSKVQDLVQILCWIVNSVASVEEVRTDNFASEDRFNRRLTELRRNIESSISRAIANEIEKFQEKYPDSEDVIRKISKEY